MRRKHNIHQSLFIFCQLLLLLALIHGCHPNTGRSNRLFFIPISLICIYTSNSTTSDYSFIQIFINFIHTSSDYILLRHHQPELRKNRPEKSHRRDVVRRTSGVSGVLCSPFPRNLMSIQAYVAYYPTPYCFL